jgi:hypothetical protein
MRRALLACWLAAAASTAIAQPTIQTDAYFSRYTGDVTPLSFPLVTAINGTLVTNLTNTVTESDGVVMQEGTLDLPTHPTSVEFKDGQVIGSTVVYSTPSVIGWTAADTQIVADPHTTPFKLGTLTLTNGIFFYDATFEITFTTSSSNPDWNGHSFTDVIHYFVTPNDGLTPACTAVGINDLDICQADYVYLQNHQNIGILDGQGQVVPSPRPGPIVFEAASQHPNTGTVELWGLIGSLDPTYYANATGGVGLPVVGAVPEAPSWLTMIAGSWAVAALIARRRRRGLVA